MKRAESLLEIKAVTRPNPLEGEELEAFYVLTDTARNPYLPASRALSDYLRETPPPCRLLFSSHTGAGKSTELNRLMKDASENFWFVLLDVQKELDLATLTHIDLVIAIIEAVYKQGHEAKLIKDKKIIEPVREWMSEIIRESRIGREEELTIEAGAELDKLLTHVVGLLAKLRSALRLSAESARIVRQVIQPRIAELRDHCNKVLIEVSKQLQKHSPARRLLVIIENTDKLDVPLATDLFVNHTGLLTELETSVIYTAPIYLVHSPDRARLKNYFEIRTLPMIKTYTMQGEKSNPGWEILREIVARRINTDKLIEPQALDLAIEKTGGVIRDLLHVIQIASEVAYYANEPRISKSAVEYSLNQLKGDYRNSIVGRGNVTTEQLYVKMRTIAESRSRRVPPDDTLQLLLYTQAVLEYNGEGWYDLHPLMRETLRDMGYLNELVR
ncbi:MAG TPA: hypothetical protein PLJ78_16740 [Anaerolineae bacterium]|nr:hypothetical protein [Anaerolineae bacterium]HQK15580.1 hypothetical protein [Anaerolineae bacterium]